MCTERHGRIVAFFNCRVAQTLSQMGLKFFNDDFICHGAGRTPGHLQLSSKEPDSSFSPGAVNAFVNRGGRGMPSLVLEVGFHESRPQLMNDAHWWYTNSEGKTRLIILMIYGNNHNTGW